MQKRIDKGSERILDITRTGYVSVLIGCMAVVLFSFWNAGALQLASTGVDDIASVEARFLLLENIGRIPLIILNAVITYLAFYSLISWLKLRESFWLKISIFNVISTVTLLTLLNMKWPVLIFILGIALTLYVYGKNISLGKVGIFFVGFVISFLAITAFVWRVSFTPEPETDYTSASRPNSVEALFITAQNVGDFAARAGTFALFRMANPPHYYSVYRDEGALCNGPLSQLDVNNSCRPSLIIYSNTFGEDGFEGRGTSPASAHITAYSLGGWPFSLTILVLTSIVLGLFSTIVQSKSILLNAFAMSGVLAGYHFSQLPFEGPFIYDHGLVWVVTVLVALKTVAFVSRKVRTVPISD
jgi:hypothetical protein